MENTKLYTETFERLLEEEFELKKQFIKYDELIDELIATKNKQILEWEIKMKQTQMAVLMLQNDIVRIREEQQKSNYKFIHNFINPTYEYHLLTKKE